MPQISADGRYLAFMSGGARDPRIGLPVAPVFICDRNSGITVQVSRMSQDGLVGGVYFAFSPIAISGDGHSVAFSATDDYPSSTNPIRRTDILVYQYSGDLTPIATPTPAQLPETGQQAPPSRSSITWVGIGFSLLILACGIGWSLRRFGR
jgi:hypothetical protein